MPGSKGNGVVEEINKHCIVYKDDKILLLVCKLGDEFCISDINRTTTKCSSRLGFILGELVDKKLSPENIAKIIEWALRSE